MPIYKSTINDASRQPAVADAAAIESAPLNVEDRVEKSNKFANCCQGFFAACSHVSLKQIFYFILITYF